MKKKLILCLLFITLILFGTGITYSVFTSDSLLSSNQKIAKFIFNAEEVDSLELPLSDLYPGVKKEYQFEVSNNSSGKTSNVTLNYNMTIKTYHFMPTVIKLYRIEDENETLVLNCDETYNRNDYNELLCNTETEEMSYSSSEIHNYKLEVEFPSTYNSKEYTDLVDYINLEINSWQKIGSGKHGKDN